MDNFNNYFEDIKSNEIELLKLRNTDHKEIADKVKVIDYSSTTFKHGGELDRIDFDKLDFDTVFMVIETNCKVYYKVPNFEYKQDLVIVDLNTKVQYRVISGHTKLI
jgi:hypothetical protein